MVSTSLTEQRKHVEDLIDLIGREWIDHQVRRYHRFRASKSPLALWSHRKPKVSPLIPAIHEYRNPRDLGQKPLGYWFGDPTVFLTQIAEQVELFRPYWASIPNDRGRKNLRYMLKDATRFSGFLHESTVATHYELSGDFTVEPLFLDPAATKGKPDVVLRNNGDEIGVQCKARSPTEALSIPFDLFQYLAGLLIRIAEDADVSCVFTISLKQHIGQYDVEECADAARGLLASGLHMPYPAKYSKYDLHVRQRRVAAPGLSGEQVLEETRKSPGNLFVLGAGLHPEPQQGLFQELAIISVSSSKGLDFVPWILGTAWDAAKESPRDVPIWLSLHVFGAIDFEIALQQSSSQKAVRDGLVKMFSKYPHVQRVYLSSDIESYLDLPSSGGELISQMKAVQFNNPEFINPAQIPTN